ncbi:cysteine desulfurase family protein [Aestuariimicrobium ganziense]|uniref:cysteine desulfurase family protein n=1 Tax=Aestuariimicrobium ganziense TaxID=2773677 RepID=UPI001944B1E3|nr:aminotransferase class V-fold PLP-dependent enzyme [Aestuariimicrobium ganziense]
MSPSAPEPGRVHGRSYLDHAANSPLRPVARSAWLEATEAVGNPSALHGSARAARRVLEDAREQLADDLGAHPTEVLFTSGGSEADSLAVVGGVRASGRERLVVSAVEHPAVLGARALWRSTEVVGADETARLDLDALTGALDDTVGLVSVQTVNNEVGTLQPTDLAAQSAHRVGARFHTDAVQALLWPGVDFAASPADLVSLSGHKVGAPVGVGVLLARRDAPLDPIGLGGRQERDVRSGTQSAALAAAMAAAVAELTANRDEELSRVRTLGARLRRIVLEIEGASLNGAGDGELAHPGIVSATFDGIRADDLLLLLDREGIDASVGSACRAGVHQPSEVVLACGGGHERAISTVRFSLGHSSSSVDLDPLATVLPAAVGQARASLGGRRTGRGGWNE